MTFPSASFALIKTNPLLNAVTFPLLDTFAIDESIGAHVIFAVFVKSSAVNLAVSPTF